MATDWYHLPFGRLVIGLLVVTVAASPGAVLVAVFKPSLFDEVPRLHLVLLGVGLALPFVAISTLAATWRWAVLNIHGTETQMAFACILAGCLAVPRRDDRRPSGASSSSVPVSPYASL